MKVFVAVRTSALLIPVILPIAMVACIGGKGASGRPDDDNVGESSTTTTTTGSGGDPTPDPGTPESVRVHLVPRSGVSGLQRVNFAVPLARGALGDAAAFRVLHEDVELPAARRGLANHPDGTLRSVQIQVDLDISGETDLDVRLGEPSTAGDLDLAPVESTLTPEDGTEGPRVWALLPADYLSWSGAFGRQVPEADVEGTALAAWSDLCDYEAYDINAFLSLQADGAVWLYDRGTVMYRGYARRGDLGTLETAYRETAIYRAGITGSGDTTDIGVPGKQGDLKYFYTQNMAIHYLLSGDDRFRESAEQIASRAAQLWDPHYDGDNGMWTERHAGFLLLADLWAAMVSDDQAEGFLASADNAVAEYLGVQESYPSGYGDQDARCFAHTAEAHAEDFGYWGCSPWMSAILADGLEAYAAERGGAQADAARAAIVKLGRAIAAQGRDGDGRPYYWMGEGNGLGEVDDADEHWGESAYILAMAWFYSDKQDAALAQAADELISGFQTYGSAPHMRSFNWQCRSAVASPYYLK